jgi:long-chain fatty acid transport protein
MRRHGWLWTAVVGTALFSLGPSSPALAAGFGFFEQGSKAMGMAGAFTAQADDPSALFHNVAGIAFQRQRAFQIGTTLTSLGDSTFRGEAPFPGPGSTGEQEDNLLTPSHVYFVQPLGEAWTFGVGLNDPFGLATEWSDPDRWSGRFLSTRAELRTYDLTPSLAWQVTPKLGIGFGAVVRFAEVELDRRAAQPNPFTFTASEVAKVKLTSDLDEGFGFTVGLLHRYNNSFSWGLSYRSKVEVDFGGDGRLAQVLTGSPQFDAAVAATLPFGRALPIETSVEFPDMASFGVAVALSAHTMLELDVNWTGWSSFDEVTIVFTENPELTSTLPENWDDAYNYRAGLRWNSSPAHQWRLGYVYDETPQPDETVSPLLPDNDRNGFTVGYGYRGGKYGFDLAFMLIDFGERTTHTTVDNFNGSYESSAYLLGLTFTWGGAS